MDICIKKLAFVVIVIILVITTFFMFRKKTGTLILLNGTSSSGKSAILKELQKLESDYKVLKVDDWFPNEVNRIATNLGWSGKEDAWFFLHSYLFKTSNNAYFDVELREKLFDFTNFFKLARDMVVNGENVVIDTVLEYDKVYKEFDEVFKDLDVFKILVYCPLDILLERVELRNRLGIPEERRSAFLAFEQFSAIYKIQDNENEQIVEIINSKLMRNALDQAIEELIKNGIPKIYLSKLKKIKNNFIKQFKLEELDEIKLVVKHRYNLILNSGKNSPEKLAQDIKTFLIKK